MARLLLLLLSSSLSVLTHGAAGPCADTEACGAEASTGAALLQLSKPRAVQLLQLPHDPECDPTKADCEHKECHPDKPEFPSADIDGPARFEKAAQSKVIVDIGGNNGDDVNLFIKNNPDAQIFTFEPIPRYFQDLQVKFNGTKVSVNNYGISDANAQREFVIDGAGTTGLDHNVQGEHVQVSLRDIDEVLTWVQKQTGQVPDMLNMNCEGCEYAVMQRMAEKGWLEKIRFIQLSWHIAEDVQDRVGKRCSVEERLWQTHKPMFKSIYGWVGWQLAA